MSKDELEKIQNELADISFENESIKDIESDKDYNFKDEIENDGELP